MALNGNLDSTCQFDIPSDTNDLALHTMCAIVKPNTKPNIQPQISFVAPR